MRENLLKILREKDVSMTKKGHISLYDFVEKIIGSKNPVAYVSKIKDHNPIIINEKEYISPESCLNILKNAKFTKCRELYNSLKVEDGDKSSIIDVNNNIFQFEGKRFTSFFIDKGDGKWDIWMYGAEVARFLGYVDQKQAIQDSVDENNKLSLDKLCEIYVGVINLLPKTLDKKTKFINLSGFCNLIHHSKKPFAMKIKKWLDDEVIPALIMDGVYTMQPKELKVKFFYEDNYISNYFGKNCLYMAYVGIYNGVHIFKFGLTRRMFERDYLEHRKSFDKFMVIFIGECDNDKYVESMFKKELSVRGLDRSLVINGKTQTELFTITTKFDDEFFVTMMTDLIKDNPLPAVKEAENKITVLENTLDVYKSAEDIQKLHYQSKISDSQARIAECQVKMAEIEYKLTDNFKLELDKEIRVSENNLKAKQTELEIVRAQSKQAPTNVTYTNDFSDSNIVLDSLNVVVDSHVNKLNNTSEKGDISNVSKKNNTKNNTHNKHNKCNTVNNTRSKGKIAKNIFGSVRAKPKIIDL